MKLWNKDQTTLSEAIEIFTIGNDKIFDVLLAKQDVIGSIAHVKMLHSIGILSEEEIIAVENALQQILKTINEGNFVIEEHVEDVHSQIEMMLTNSTVAGQKSPSYSSDRQLTRPMFAIDLPSHGFSAHV